VSHTRLYLIVVGLFVLIFLLDASTPVGEVVAILYVVPLVWFGVWSPPNMKVAVAMIGAVSTVLALLGFFIYTPEESTWADLMNRMLALCAMWSSVVVILLRKEFEQDLFEKWRREP
jgi:hypothetical protein